MVRLYAILFCCALGWNTYAQVVINEICPANADGMYDPNFYNFSGWVELYNGGNANVTVGGYHLSDKLSDKTKWSIPGGTVIQPKGFLLIWCDEMNTGMHTNFSMDSDGEELVLSTASSTVVDQITFPQQYTNISYGRVSNGASTWGYLLTPTPKTSNNPATASNVLAQPVFSLAPGRYSGLRQVSLLHGEPDVEIRYTADGSEPTASSTVYTSSISVSGTRTIKAKAFKQGYVPSNTIAGTYFISEHAFTLPVVSISTKFAYLWDDYIGIYTDGKNGIPGNCRSEPLNWNQDWDRHASFEYFKPDGTRVLEQQVDIRIGGACSRGQPQKSFVIKARDKYGKKTFDGRFFDSKDVNEFGGFMLRNSGNDFNVTMFRDALMQSLMIGRMDVDYMAYQPTIFYLDGAYWGIQNLREKIDADFIESNYGLKKDEIDLLETWENAIEGTPDAYLNYKNTLQAMDRSTSDAFTFIEEHIDVQEYINYLVAEIYYCNTDWPGNNMKFWRPRTADGKFRWILWDTDFGFALYQDASYATHATLNFATDPDNTDWPNPAWSTQHIRMVLENPEFRSRFIRTFNTALNTTFAPERVISYIDAFQDRIKTEIPYHKQRWGGNISNWNYEVQRLRDFATARNTYMRQHLASFFGLSESIAMTITTVPAEAGTFKLNNVKADAPLEAGGYFKGLPYEVEPVAATGYKFKEWKIRKREATAVPLITSGDTWKYFDQGTSPGAGWVQAGFDDASWAQGPAQLGYGEGDEQTIVGFGPNPDNKFITTYFRKTFEVDDLTNLTDISATLLVDDGAVVYLNGMEVYRSDIMPAGTITNTTVATQAVTIENSFTPFTIVKELLQQGVNVLAVEVHQNAGNSSDVSFDLSMSTVKVGNETEETTDVALVSDVAYTDVFLEATFEPDDRTVTGIVINEINATPSAVKDAAGDAEDWIELYNTGTKPVNLAGLFITDNISQKKKHLLQAGTGNEMVVAPGAYKVLWADEELGEGADHLSFKLSADGEDVGLYQELDGVINVLDEVTFGAQPVEGSWSRIPNATGPFELTALSTPREANAFVMGVPDEELFGVYPNPVTTGLLIRSPAPVKRAELMDCYGRTIRVFANVQPEDWLPMENITPGLYLLRIQSASAWQVVKIVKE